MLSLPSAPPEQYCCSQDLCAVTVAPCYTHSACLCAGVPLHVRGVGQRPEILMGTAILLCFSSDDELQANSKGSDATAGFGICPELPVVKLSVACGC